MPVDIAEYAEIFTSCGVSSSTLTLLSDKVRQVIKNSAETKAFFENCILVAIN